MLGLSLSLMQLNSNQETMKVTDYLRRSLSCCLSTSSHSATTATSNSPTPTIKNRLSSTLTDIFKPGPHHHHQEPQEDQDSLIDATASFTHSSTSPLSHRPRHHHHHHRSTIVGTIYGRRRGHVRLCFQSDSSIPPPFLFHLSVPTHHLAKEMNSGLLRVSLECHKDPHQTSSSRHQQPPVWKAYCNGRRVGYAVRRKPNERDKAILNMVRTMSAGAGVLSFSGGGGESGEDEEKEEGELLYMRASYERVVGSRDSVSYHLINPGGAGGGSPGQELSVFLLRSTG